MPAPDCPSTPAAHTPLVPSYARWRHTLRSPLNAILTAVAVLETCPADSAAAIEARSIIARQTRNLAWLISEMPGDDNLAA